MYQDITIKLLTTESLLSSAKGIEGDNGDNLNLAEIFNSLEGETEIESKYPFLSTIDPYGYTIFGYLQCQRLLAELEVIYSKYELANQELILLTLSKLNRGEYILFIGD